MDQYETVDPHDEPAGEKLTVTEIGIFALLCIMSAATIVTLAMKG